MQRWMAQSPLVSSAPSSRNHILPSYSLLQLSYMNTFNLSLSALRWICKWIDIHRIMFCITPTVCLEHDLEWREVAIYIQNKTSRLCSSFLNSTMLEVYLPVPFPYNEYLSNKNKSLNFYRLLSELELQQVTFDTKEIQIIQLIHIFKSS